MKIIKDGIKPEEKVYRVTCGKCGCLFEFVEHEAKYVPDQRAGDFLQVVCPCCGAFKTKYL